MPKKEDGRKGRQLKIFICFGLVIAILSVLAYFHSQSKLKTTLDMDFTQSSNQMFDCTNKRFLSSNYDWITIKFISSSPVGGGVRVSLYVDKNDDGTYVPTEHSEVLWPGESIQSRLPYGKDAKEYRIVFQCLTDDIDTASFFVMGGKLVTPYFW